MKMNWIVFISLQVIVCLLSFSAPEKRTTLNDCYILGINRSEILADQQEQVTQAQEHYNQALGSLFPSAIGTFVYSKSDTTGLLSTQTADQTTMKVAGLLPLFRGIRLTSAIKQNEHLITAQKEAYQFAALQIYADVSQAFYLLLYLQNDKKLLEEEQGLYEKRMMELKERVRIGRSRMTEIYTVQVSVSTLKALILQTQAQIQVAENLLRFITGIDGQLILEDTAPSEPLKPIAFYLSQLASRPDIHAAEARIRSAKEGVTIASDNMNLLAPSIDLAGNYYLMRPSPYQNTAWDLQIQLTLPNFFSYTNQSKINEVNSIQRQLEVALKKLQRKSKEDIEDTFRNLLSEQKQIDLFTQAVNASDKNVHSVNQDYQLGLSTNLDVLTALNAYTDTQRSLNKIRYAFKTDRAKLVALTSSTIQQGDKVK